VGISVFSPGVELRGKIFLSGFRVQCLGFRVEFIGPRV